LAARRIFKTMYEITTGVFFRGIVMKTLQTANPKVVKELLNKLIDSFQDLANEYFDHKTETLTYTDSFMVAYNFYRYVVLDIEDKCIQSGDRSLAVILRHSAIDTLIKGMGMEDYYEVKKVGRLL
jgi:uroporphyrinogen-III decarboxylase